MQKNSTNFVVNCTSFVGMHLKTLVLKVLKSQNSGFEILAFKVFDCIVNQKKKNL